jgi:hypothetical protein
VNIIVRGTDNAILKGTEIYLHDVTADTISTFEWNGTSLTVYVLNGHKYFISGAEVEGYEPAADSLQYIARAA